MEMRPSADQSINIPTFSKMRPVVSPSEESFGSCCLVDEQRLHDLNAVFYLILDTLAHWLSLRQTLHWSKWACYTEIICPNLRLSRFTVSNRSCFPEIYCGCTGDCVQYVMFSMLAHLENWISMSFEFVSILYYCCVFRKNIVMRKILNSGQTREFNTNPIIYLFTSFVCLPHILLSSYRTFLSISSFASSLPLSPVGPSLLSPEFYDNTKYEISHLIDPTT